MAQYTASETARIDVVLAKETGLSRSNLKTVIENDGVLVNGILRKKSGFEVREGDVIELVLPEPKTLDVEPNADIKLDIVYEDEHFAVINKPQGMVVHPASSYTKNDTLVNALLADLDKLSSINGVIRPGIVHRLDKDTSGLIVVAKTDEAHKSLASQIEKKSARRIYYGLCDGNFKEDAGTIDAPIARNKRDRKKMGIDPDGRRAVTHYQVLERFGKYTLVRFELETGRTHQIRVHSSHIHHPIVGDEVYGGSTALYKNGQLLHARQLVLAHPITGETMKFEADLPEYYLVVLEKLRKMLK
ncbi:MAG: RluA family pseudouridine synthase [Clostridia bacterium]|nr:RluA family pseudouridine synthase [Clostridia bacterium]MBO5983138.1 RluA family pseudouridine synthase [Clostridia bacterium]